WGRKHDRCREVPRLVSDLTFWKQDNRFFTNCFMGFSFRESRCLFSCLATHESSLVQEGLAIPRQDCLRTNPLGRGRAGRDRERAVAAVEVLPLATMNTMRG